MDAQQQLIGLMTVAEEHHKAVQTALDGLAAERAVLARECEAMVLAVRSAQASLSGTIKTSAHESAYERVKRRRVVIDGNSQAVC